MAPASSPTKSMELIQPGKLAPAFNLPDHTGTKHRLSQYKGKTVILYFYPKDDTPGCTAEACNFRDHLNDFNKMNAVILGVSPDDETKHRKFFEKYKLNFTLLADTRQNEVQTPPTCAKYGVWQQKSMYGRKYMGIARTTYLINPKGKIIHRFDKVKPAQHAEEILIWLNQTAKITNNRREPPSKC